MNNSLRDKKTLSALLLILVVISPVMV